MAKNKTENQRQPAQAAAGAWPFSYWLRLVLSIWLVWHLFVVFIAPFSLMELKSELAINTAQGIGVRWYTDPLYLNGGYSFFSPDPPRSGRLIRYQVYGDSGKSIVEGEFPNRNNPKYANQWPRLWYHRHMMLVDQSDAVRVFQAADPSPTAIERAMRQNQELALKAFARHLLRKHQGQRVVMELIVHESLSPELAVGSDDPQNPFEPMSPTDPSLYRTEMTVQVTSDELDQPLLPESPTGPGAEVLPMGPPS